LRFDVNEHDQFNQYVEREQTRDDQHKLDQFEQQFERQHDGKHQFDREG
jgi:hypothetical protein